MTKNILEVDGLVQYFDRSRPFLERILTRARDMRVHAVNRVTFDVKEGEVFSLVGESGCGKSTTARTIVRLIDPKEGRIIFEGQDIAGLDQRQLLPFRPRIQMIFQNPYASLDPRQKVGEMIMEPLLFHGIAANRKEANARMIELLDMIGLHPEQAGRYPHQFSGGQRQRLGIARALATSPRFVVADEPVSALDVSVQAQVLNLMMDLRERLGLTCLFIAHDLSVVRHISDRVAIMYLGFIVEQGNRDDIFDAPLHPYTEALLAAAPSLEKRFIHVPLFGDVPSPLNLPTGCAFASRCPRRIGRCRDERPQLRESGGRRVACHLV
ncbi:ABC transporter ATP-binding protein [Synergistales bacterium]|nr:ABC transporter ATP-binding protein [Synergistales bacterium]